MRSGNSTLTIQLAPRPQFPNVWTPLPTVLRREKVWVKVPFRKQYRTYQIVPHLSVKNDKIDQFAEVLADSYAEIFDRLSKDGIRDPERVFFEVSMTKHEFKTYVSTNAENPEILKQHVSMTWKQVTVKESDGPTLTSSPNDAIAYDIKLKHPFFLSLKTNRNMTETPLAEILEVARVMEDADTAAIQFGFQAAEPDWYKDAEADRRDFDKRKPKWWPAGKEISPPTQLKPGHTGFDFTLRLLVTSPDERRRRRIARGIILAIKQLNLDNELTEKPVRYAKFAKWLNDFRWRRIRVPWLFGRRQLVTSAEIAHFIKLPQRALQEEYAIIDNVSKPETSLPDELFMANTSGIDIGDVTEKGRSRTARIPTAAYGNVPLKYVLDAYCLPEFVFGEMGSGKTGEAIHRAHSAIRLGQTVFFFDTADGAAVKELHDSLPADYPENKIVHLDLTNKAWPIALRWATKSSDTTNDELEAEMAREAGRMFLRQFVGGMATSDFTNRMDRYLSAAARAAGSAPLDIELALTSPAFRDELLRLPHVQEQPDIAIELEALQDKARRGSDDQSVDGILSRLRALSTDRFRTNLFYQTPKKPLDFRRYADNLEGGYGYCVTVYCDKNSFGPDGQELVMTFMLAKVLLEGAYSRVDIDQNQREPFVIILDEPHRFIKGEMASKLGEDAAVELRKYRCKLVMIGHSRKQLGRLWDAFESGGIQVTMYKSKNVEAFTDMAPIIAPLNPIEAWSALGQHEAVVTRKLPSKRESSFICRMTAPPPFTKDRSRRRDECASEFGKPWKEVAGDIQTLRVAYMRKDQLWFEKVEEAEKAKKEAKDREKEERPRSKKINQRK